MRWPKNFNRFAYERGFDQILYILQFLAKYEKFYSGTEWVPIQLSNIFLRFRRFKVLLKKKRKKRKKKGIIFFLLISQKM